ncbi:hypothetical protein [Yoonia sp. R2-816]|uniref:hypothetical protein n=1 Tax=Yoonia sp. R2-816 TaxID=3342638 RepID=UPI00372C223E
MKLIATGAVAAALLVAACTPDQPVTQEANGFVEIATAEQFRNLVVGRTYGSADGRVIFQVRADGTSTGTANGNPISSQWNWNDGKFCRTNFVNGVERGTDCLRAFLRGDELRVESLTTDRIVTYTRIDDV